MTEDAKHWIDWGAAATAIGTLAGWLPALAALFTIVWTGLRIWEWIEARRARKALANRGKGE